MIRAIFHNGTIRPLDEIPGHWLDGEELTVEQTGGKLSSEELEEIDDWVAEMKAATAGISNEDHDQLMAALEEVERESKELGRREMERAPYVFPEEANGAAAKEAG